MRCGSLFTGIGVDHAAWTPLGWSFEWAAEIEAFPCAVLSHHWPGTPNLGDVTELENNEIYENSTIDVLVGGPPCQDFSVAGGRAGVDGDRGQLVWRFLDVARRKRPRWVVFENVPGLLSSDDGRAFRRIIAEFEKIGYGVAWRVLDAQYFTVAQQRRRLFVVGYLGDPRPATAVLFERESMSGHPPPSRATGQEVAGTVGGGSGTRGWCDDLDRCGAMIPTHEVSPRVQERGGKGVDSDATIPPTVVCSAVAPTQRTNYHDNSNPVTQAKTLVLSMSGRSRGDDGRGYDRPPHVRKDVVGAIETMKQPTVVYENHAQDSRIKPVEVSPQINAKAGTGGGNLPLVQAGWTVRRLTPREVERLFGLPDDYTLIPNYRKKIRAHEVEEVAAWLGISLDEARALGATPDGPRYRALGNTIVVPVLRWIGRRINMVEEILSRRTSTSSA